MQVVSPLGTVQEELFTFNQVDIRVLLASPDSIIGVHNNTLTSNELSILNIFGDSSIFHSLDMSELEAWWTKLEVHVETIHRCLVSCSSMISQSTFSENTHEKHSFTILNNLIFLHKWVCSEASKNISCLTSSSVCLSVERQLATYCSIYKYPVALVCWTFWMYYACNSYFIHFYCMDYKR